MKSKIKNRHAHLSTAIIIMLFLCDGQVGALNFPQLPKSEGNSNLVAETNTGGQAAAVLGSNEDATLAIFEIGFDAYFGYAPETPKKLAALYERFPLNRRVKHLVGRQFLREKNYEAATILLTAPAEHEPENEMLQTDAGLAYEGVGKYKEALRYFERAKALSPYSAFRYNDCARIHAALGESTQALEYWQKSLQLLPGQPEVMDKMSKMAQGIS